MTSDLKDEVSVPPFMQQAAGRRTFQGQTT
jgi:hypothetical protein